MSAIAKLPDDLLIGILRLAAGSEIYAKLNVAQVSAHWRTVALNSPLLWADIHISARSYIVSRVPLSLLLERAGPAALLDIDLSGPFPIKDGLYIATALAPYSARMRVLDTPDDIFHALLTSSLRFPALEVLRVRGVGPHRSHNRTIHLAAPNLRVLGLGSLRHLSRVEELFSERIEVVTIRLCDAIKITDILPILARCVRLAHLTYTINPTPAHREDVTSVVAPLRYLRTLCLTYPFPDILDLLDRAVDPHTVLQTVSISTSCNCEADCVQRICAAVSRGLGQLVSLKLYEEFTCLLRDDAGLTRDMRVMNIPQHSWAHIWPYSSRKHDAQTGIVELHIPLRYWNEFAEGFAQYPPGRNLRVLRLLVWIYDFCCAESDLPALKTLVLPGLERVELSASGRTLPAVGVIYALRSISSGDEVRPIAVAVSGLAQSLVYLRELIQKTFGGRDGGCETWNFVGALE